MAEHAHCHHHAAHDQDHGAMVTDPVCGMKVDTRTAEHRYRLGETVIIFAAHAASTSSRRTPTTISTRRQKIPRLKRPRWAHFPKQPQARSGPARCIREIRRNGPGHCPICGMALEPLEPTLEEGPNPELIDMSRRFWVSAVLSLPIDRPDHGRRTARLGAAAHADCPFGCSSHSRRRSCCGAAGRSSSGLGVDPELATSTCSR